MLFSGDFPRIFFIFVWFILETNTISVNEINAIFPSHNVVNFLETMNSFYTIKEQHQISIFALKNWVPFAPNPRTGYKV